MQKLKSAAMLHQKEIRNSTRNFRRTSNAVKNALINKYGIAADRLSAIGMGATDKLFEEVEFNRVATFNDTKK